ncbi:MAG: AraC family transcriptional regulator [Sphingobium sp.]|nr:AraC family transcriptional regulator [Sphingobium sp.]
MLGDAERFSTHYLAHQRRHLFWRDVIAGIFPGMTAYPSEGIKADIALWSLGEVRFARARSDQARVSRMQNKEGHNIILHLQQQGRSTMAYGDQTITANIGDIIIADDNHPYAIEILGKNDCMVIQVPVSALPDEMRGGHLHGRHLSGKAPNIALLGALVRNLWDQHADGGAIDEDYGAVLTDAIRIACRGRGADMKAEVQTAAEPSLIEYALGHLTDPAMGTALLCEVTGLSSRAVQKAFLRHTAMTPTSFIAERRLLRAADLLRLSDERSITDIAFQVGFSDAGFFSRCFRKRFGAAPREWRSSGAETSLS